MKEEIIGEDEIVTETYEEIPSDLFLNPDHSEFKTFFCPNLGYISPKTCQVCIPRTKGKCPLEKGAEC